MTVIHPPLELSANRNIYFNRFREGVFRPRLVEDRVIQGHAMTIGVTSGVNGVTQRHAIGAGTTSGPYSNFQSHATGADITSGEDRVTQSHTTGVGTGSGAYHDIQGHASSSGGHITQSYAIGAGARNQTNQNNRCQSTEKRIRLRVVPVKVRDSLSGRMLETHALLDNGSDVSRGDSELVKE